MRSYFEQYDSHESDDLNKHAAMSETSDTKERYEVEAVDSYDPRWDGCKWVVVDRVDTDIICECLNHDDAERIATALNQPAASGPGLTEEERRLLVGYTVGLHRRVTELKDRQALRKDNHSRQQNMDRIKERIAIVANLLTRDAKADTVTLRRESLATFLAYCANRRPFELDDTRLCAAIAEAEAALAKGGE